MKFIECRMGEEQLGTRFGIKAIFNPQAPVEQKIADEVVFRRFQGEGVELF